MNLLTLGLPQGQSDRPGLRGKAGRLPSAAPHSGPRPPVMPEGPWVTHQTGGR